MNTSFATANVSTTSARPLDGSARNLKLLSQCSRAVTRISNDKALLAEICRIAVEVGGYRMAWVGCTRPDDKYVTPCAFAGHEAGYLTDFRASWAPLPEGTPGPIGAALRSRTVHYCLDLEAPAPPAGPEPCEADQAFSARHQAALAHGYRSLLALPLVHGDEVLGVLALYGEAAFDAVPEGEIDVLREVADNLAFALKGLRDRSDRSRREHSIIKVLAGLSGPPGQAFFQHMVSNLAQALRADGVTLIRLQADVQGQGRVLAGVMDGQALALDSLVLANFPCGQLLATSSVLQAGPLAQLYPKAVFMTDVLAGHVSATFIGHRMEDSSGKMLGMLSAVFRNPPRELDLLRATLRVFASRAAAELECMDADLEIRRLNISLEERVQQRTAQLKLANEELESFCYSVSHDLRTPLSAVDGFAHLLEQALDSSAAPLADKKRHYLRRIRAGMVQMGELIEALLQLARLARAPMSWVPVDLSHMAEEMLMACREREPARMAVAEVEPGLTALGDARLIRQLLGNLLGNAWKFSGGKEVTSIRFARAAAHDKLANGQPVFVVEDKGAGFNMAYAQNLFGPFQRLHSPSEFEGSGIGLATVQRIVNRHGGRVWGEAEPGQGARFYFSLGSPGNEP